jgi:hypothetical protein
MAERRQGLFTLVARAQQILSAPERKKSTMQRQGDLADVVVG